MTIQIDKSCGQGHHWVACTPPADILVEIECEMIDGGATHCADFVASNGQHYRW